MNAFHNISFDHIQTNLITHPAPLADDSAPAAPLVLLFDFLLVLLDDLLKPFAAGPGCVTSSTVSYAPIEWLFTTKVTEIG